MFRILVDLTPTPCYVSAHGHWSMVPLVVIHCLGGGKLGQWSNPHYYSLLGNFAQQRDCSNQLFKTNKIFIITLLLQITHTRLEANL